MCPDSTSIYNVPLNLEKEEILDSISKKLNFKKEETNLDEWKKYISIIQKENKPTFQIALVGKYTSLSDSYLSVTEALKHAAAANLCNVEISYINSEVITEKNIYEKLKKFKGILIPGGFGDRGIEGKIIAAKYARENNIPFLGLCLGMHIAIIEFARNILKLEDAHSTEFNQNTDYPVIDFLPHQRQIHQKGGTMRLGSYPCVIEKNTLLYNAYQCDQINERHRHRYEFNNDFKNSYEENGGIFSGLSPDGDLVEVFEINTHKWYLGCQFHPEFKSRPYKALPLFINFLKACIN